MNQKNNETHSIKELDVVALLADAPAHNLSRGQVGTVVLDLDKDNVLVEFSDNSGAAYAIEPFAKSQLLPLIHESRAA
jgi:predicted HAD superfamily phosphohydrolase YqeG